MDEDLFAWTFQCLIPKLPRTTWPRPKISYHEQRIVDTDNGVLGFTTVEGDLLAQMQSHLADMESAEAWRAKQDKQFQFASANMQEEAVPLVCDLSNGSFVAFAQVAQVMGRQGRPCFAFFNSQSTRLKVVAKLGDQYLS